MANVSLIFYGIDDETSLECYANRNDNITIEFDGDAPNLIELDKSTAIKFAKTLRTEINKISEDGTR
jgi:hypothetical protein